LSPDGRSFVFVSDHGGTPDIWLRQVSGGEPVRLTNDDAEEADLAYAPDGESVYFTRVDANGIGIWQTGVLGGMPRKVVDNAQKPALSRDGRSLAYLTSATPASGFRGFEIAISGLNGGGRRTLVRGVPAAIVPPRPAWSPDGRWVAYTAGALFSPLSMFVVDVDTGQQHQVIQLPPGTVESGQPAWLPDSRHLVVPYIPVSRQQSPNDLGIVDIRDGSISRLTTTVGEGFSAPSVSADGSRLITTSVRRFNEVWTVPLGGDADANGHAAVRLVDSSMAPMWTFVSRNGRTLLFNSPASGTRNLWIMPVDGSAPSRQITAVPSDAVSHSSLSPDGTHVAFASIASGHSDIWTQNVDGTDLRQLTNDEPADLWPVWSPDGQWVAYLSSRIGGEEAWRVPSSGGSPERFSDGPMRGDWIRRPEGDGTWTVRGGVELVDVERHAVVWREPLSSMGAGLSLPTFSPDGRWVSAPFREARDHDAIRIFDTATGKSRVAVRLPFHVAFRASWVDGGHSMIVNRNDQVTHIVLLDHFWSSQRSR
jgi:Tol biopolymer transport system component